MLEEIRQILSATPDVTLVAVSKYHPASLIQQCYDEGQRIFGESRVQELVEKVAVLPNDIEWHFIGHLQRNKVKQIVPFVSLIHSIDSYRLLEEVSKQAEDIRRCIPVLLQLHVAQEETKFGFSIEECRKMLLEKRWQDLRGVKIVGIMCMASNTKDTKRIRRDFRVARQFFDEINSQFNGLLSVRSYGMSGDFPIAIEEGATHIRVGSMIFGNREY